MFKNVLVVAKGSGACVTVRAKVHPGGFVSYPKPVANLNGVLWPVRGLGNPNVTPTVHVPASVFHSLGR